MTNDNFLATFLAKPPAARKSMWFNAMKIVRTRKAGDVKEAARLLDQYETIELSGKRPETTKPVGTLMYEPHNAPRFISFGYSQDEMVVSIRMTEQHRTTDMNPVFEVRVLGQVLQGLFREVGDAREAATKFYASRHGEPV